MGESLTQRHRVKDEGLRIVNFCQLGTKVLRLIAFSIDGTQKGSLGLLRASSRGKTGEASVVRNYWA
jgi:hypothetical protein